MTVTPQKKKPVHVGLSITKHAVEIAVFSPRSMAIEQVVSLPVPDGVFDLDADTILDPNLLKEIIGQLLRSIKPKPSLVHLSLPGTLLRLVEMPRMVEPAGLYVSLSSEAERYKSFDNTEAVVDFVILNNPNLPPNQQEVVFGATRSDTLALYLRMLKDLKLKATTITLEPLNILRGLAGSGVLDALMQQIGTDAYWGMIFVEPARVRLSVWQADRLIEMRETQMETANFVNATADSILVEDMLEEIRRTTKTIQPTLWLTHDLPPAMEHLLSERTGSPFRVAPTGEAIQLPAPVQLSTLGSALTSVVNFPFDLDISASLGKVGGASQAAGSAEMAGDGSEISWMVPAGLAVFVICCLLTGGLFAANLISGAQLPDLKKKQETAKLEVATLEGQQRELQKKVELDKSLLEMVNNSRIRNHVYVALTQDLAEKTPEKVWIHTLKVSDTLEMLGKALNHQSVINFARSFDSTPYSRAILIDSIKEGRLNGTLVYDFKIAGNVFLNPALLSNTENAAEPAQSDSVTDSKTDSGKAAGPKSGA